MRHRKKFIGVAATVVCVVLLSGAGCIRSRIPAKASPPPLESIVSTAPPVPGASGATLQGYLTSAGRESETRDGIKTTRYTISVQWGSPTPDRQSDLLVVDSTVVVLGGVRDTSMTSPDKIAAITRYLSSPPEPHAVTVTYTASKSPGARASTEHGYPYSVATWIVVAPLK